MTLKGNSETAERVAAAFSRFREFVPEHETEIAATVSELFAISYSLLKLNEALGNAKPPGHRAAAYLKQREVVERDQRTVLKSLENTFRDLKRLFSRLDSDDYLSSRQAYQGVWRDIGAHFREENNTTLAQRLECYRTFINELAVVSAEGGEPGRRFRDLRYRIEKLLDKQGSSLELAVAHMSLGTPKQKSWERIRPGGRHHDMPPLGLVTRQAPPRLFDRTARRPDFSPFSPMPPDYEDDDYFMMRAPEPPVSPSGSTATPSTLSSAASCTSNDHWVPIAFGQSRSTTKFKTSGSESGCFGEHMPGASASMRNEYEQILKLYFEEGQIEARIFIRPTDSRARLLIRQEPRVERSARSVQSCQPVTSLRIVRKDSCLQLCTTGRRGLVLWANLRFPSYERLVLFHCAFLALKAQDEANPVSRLEDTYLHGESRIFNGIITDDNFEHVLQVFKDEDSGGIRLQASALHGPLKRSPVWTAFITYSIASTRWQRLFEPRKVHLRELTRYIFSNDYEPHLGPGGEHELFFQDPEDARLFMNVIDDLAEGKL